MQVEQINIEDRLIWKYTKNLYFFHLYIKLTGNLALDITDMVFRIPANTFDVKVIGSLNDLELDNYTHLLMTFFERINNYNRYIFKYEDDLLIKIGTHSVLSIRSMSVQYFAHSKGVSAVEVVSSLTDLLVEKS
jgi:hypothetical protein